MTSNTLLLNYLNYYKNSKTHELSNTRDIEELYKEIKEELYNFNTYKWSLKSVIYYIQLNEIDSKDFIEFIKHVFNIYFSRISKKGKKGAFIFIETLENSKKLISSGINLKKEKEVLEFLREMKSIKNNYLDISVDSFIKFIDENFNTGFKSTYLRNIYFQQLD